MAIDAFLGIDDVKGEAQDVQFKDRIDVLAWSWGVSNSGTSHFGGGGGSGKMSAQDLSITKWVDMSSHHLITKVADGTHFAKAVLVLRKSGGEKPVEFWQLSMEHVMVTSYSTGGSPGEDRITENISLNFRGFNIQYKLQDKDGTVKGDDNFKWNIATNSADDEAPGVFSMGTSGVS